MAESILSYAQFLKDIKNFKSSGTESGEDTSKDFNLLDTPAQKYFKILFYFGSMPENDTDSNHLSGLLAPTWEVFNKRNNAEFAQSMNPLQYYDFNSAWSYLMLNDELERAEKLEQFVTLLSDINTYSPWYFTSIGGINEALERKAAEDGKIDMNDRKKLSIKCLPDAFDNRITTLLELYRDITWSWVQKKEIIPANLRKFNMAVYIFEAPNNVWHYSDFRCWRRNRRHSVGCIRNPNNLVLRGHFIDRYPDHDQRRVNQPARRYGIFYRKYAGYSRII
jgi:hypothetical protein